MDDFEYTVDSTVAKEMIPTGFVDLDKATGGGLPRGQLTVVMGQPTVGKSGLCISILNHVTRLDKTNNVGVFSSQLHVKHYEFAILAARAKIKFGEIVTEEERQRALIERKSMEHRLWICTSVTLRNFFLKDVFFGHVIIVDDVFYLERFEDKKQRRDVLRVLKTFARRNRAAIVVTCTAQGIHRRPDKRPRLSDISSVLVDEADLVLGVYRDELVHTDTSEKGVAEINILKNRLGPKEMVKLAFQPAYNSFHNLARI